MAANITLADIRTQIRRRANMENSQFVTDAELTGYVNAGLQELYDLITASSEDYYTTSATIAVDGVLKSYALPANFYKLMGVDYNLGGFPTSMQRFVFNDRNRYVNTHQVIRYRIVGSNIHFEPLPPAQTMTVWYIPAMTKLVADGDTFDAINGWEEYVILDGAIKCLVKEESDPSVLLAQKQGAMVRVQGLAKARDNAFPEKVTDASRHLDAYAYRFGEDY